jgi:hypothetical protein
MRTATVPHSDSLDDEHSRRATGRGENRLAPAAAVVVAAVTYALLPDSLLFAHRLVIPAIELVLLIALLLTDPVRLSRQTRWSRASSVALASVVVVTNLISLGLLIAALVRPSTQSASLLLGALQVWLTNVIGFGLLFWELDRGGPVLRSKARRDEFPPAEWRFSQDENNDTVTEVSATASARSGWVPTFIDYLYVSLTNSSAFSPTDTMPLSHRAKILMSVEATSALLISLLVIAHAVGSIGGGGGG